MRFSDVRLAEPALPDIKLDESISVEAAESLLRWWCDLMANNANWWDEKARSRFVELVPVILPHARHMALMLKPFLDDVIAYGVRRGAESRTVSLQLGEVAKRTIILKHDDVGRIVETLAFPVPVGEARALAAREAEARA